MGLNPFHSCFNFTFRVLTSNFITSETKRLIYHNVIKLLMDKTMDEKLMQFQNQEFKDNNFWWNSLNT